MRHASDNRRHRLGLAVAFACAAMLLPATARAYTVDHQGIYLVQRIGQCLNHTGPCYFGGQCPGGEYTTNRFTNGRVYCSSFYPPAPYPPSLFESLFGIR